MEGDVVCLGDLGQGHPNVYLETSDLDTALARVRELGGEAGETIGEVSPRITAEIPAAEIQGRFGRARTAKGTRLSGGAEPAVTQRTTRRPRDGHPPRSRLAPRLLAAYEYRQLAGDQRYPIIDVI